MEGESEQLGQRQVTRCRGAADAEKRTREPLAVSGDLPAAQRHLGHLVAILEEREGVNAAQITAGKKVYDANGSAAWHMIGGKGGKTGTVLDSVGKTRNAGQAYGYVAAPKTKQTHRAAHEQTQDR